MVSATSIPLAPVIATAADGELRAIPLNQLHPSPTNPRKSVDDAYIEELAASIDHQGQLAPFLVREVRDEYFEVIAGSCRLRAQQLRQQRGKLTRDDLMMCVLRDVTDEQVLEMQITENLQRKDVHPMDEAEGYRKLLEMSAEKGEGGATDEGSHVEALAKKLGKSKSFVWQRLKLVDLAPKAAKLFREGKLTTSHAIDCARLTPADQEEYVKHWSQYRNEGGASVRDMRWWIAQEVRVDLSKAPFSPKDETLVKDAGACLNCAKCSGSRPELLQELADDTNTDDYGRRVPKKSDKPALVCLDTTCYRRKVQTFVQRKSEEVLRETGAEPVLVWGGDPWKRPYSGPESKLPTREAYEIAKKADECKHTKPAIVAGGSNVGQKLFICSASGCDVHRNHRTFGAPRGTDDSYAKQQAEAQRKVRLENEARAQAFRAILHAVNGKKCPVDDLRAIALAHLEEMVHDTTVHMGKALGWEVKKGNGQYRDLMKDATKKAGAGRLLWLMLAMTLARNVAANTWGGESLTKGAELLHAIGGRYGVDLNKIRADLQAADKAKREAKAQKERAKKQKLAAESRRKLRDLAKGAAAA